MFGARLTAIDEELRAVDRTERAELDAALQAQQGEYIQAVLRGRTTWSAVIPGIGWTVKARVLALGVFSAADLTAERLDALRPLGTGVVQALAGWRTEGENEARRGAPQSLPTRVRDPVVARAGRERARLQAARDVVERDRSSSRSATDAVYAQRYQVLHDDLAARGGRYEEAASRLQREFAELEAEAQSARNRLGEQLAELQPYSRISLGAYLGRVFASLEG